MSKQALVIAHVKHIARLVQVNLERSGYTVATADNLMAALVASEQQHPDIVVVDSSNPDSNAIIQALKANPNTCDIPVSIIGNNRPTP